MEKSKKEKKREKSMKKYGYDIESFALDDVLKEIKGRKKSKKEKGLWH